MQLFWALLLAHLVADFLQPAWLVAWIKRGTWGQIVHVTSYALLSSIVLFGYGRHWFAGVVVLSATHFAVDHAKNLLASRRHVEGVHIFLLDQALHVAIIAGVALWVVSAAPPTPLMAQAEGYPHVLPLACAYVAVTFAASILVFETSRTFIRQPGTEGVASWRYRFWGMLERGAALTLVLAGLAVLAPVAYAYSAYRVSIAAGAEQRRLCVELAASIASLVLVCIALLL